MCIRRVGDMIQTASYHLPWRCRCMAQAIAGKFMLARRGIRSTLFIGVKKNEAKDTLQSHAWLTSGDLYVTGEKGHERFRVITNFTEAPPPA